MANTNKAIESFAFFLQSNENLGAIEIGTFLGLVLFGVALGQGYKYFTRGGSDPFSMKLMVFLLIALECLHSFESAHGLYLASVTDWKQEKVNSYPISITVLLEGIITFLVQGFYAYRIYRITQRALVPCCCFFLAFSGFNLSVALSVLAIIDAGQTPNGLVMHKDRTLITAALVMEAITDVLIAASLTYDARRMLSELKSARTATALNRVVRWSLQAGIVTSVVSLSVAVAFRAMSNMVWLGLYIILAKLYSVSLLIALNGRQLNGCTPSTYSKAQESRNSSTTRVRRGSV